MGERLKLLRSTLGMSMREFAAKIGLTAGAISLLEKGERNISNHFIVSICNVFNVNEDWFRYGTGEMFGQKTRDQEIADIVATIYKDDNDFRRKLITAIAGLTAEQMELLEQIAKELTEK